MFGHLGFLTRKEPLWHWPNPKHRLQVQVSCIIHQIFGDLEQAFPDGATYYLSF